MLIKVGKADSNKLQSSVHEIIAIIKEEPLGMPIYLITKQEHIYELETLFLQQLSTATMMRLHIVTLKQFVEEQCFQHHIFNISPISNMQLDLHIINIISETSLSLLQHSSNKLGMIEKIRNAYIEFKELGYTSIDYAKLSLSNLTLNKIRDLNIIFAELQRRTCNQKVGGEPFLDFKALNNIEISKVYVCGYDSFTYLEKVVIDKIASVCDITIHIDNDINNTTALYSLTDNTIKVLNGVVKQYESMPIRNTFNFDEFITPYQEVEYVASTIYKKIVDGKKYEDFIIYAKDDKYKELLKRNLDLLQIPYYYEQPIKTITAVDSLIMKLMGYLQHKDQDSLVSILYSGLLNSNKDTYEEYLLDTQDNNQRLGKQLISGLDVFDFELEQLSETYQLLTSVKEKLVLINDLLVRKGIYLKAKYFTDINASMALFNEFINEFTNFEFDLDANTLIKLYEQYAQKSSKEIRLKDSVYIVSLNHYLAAVNKEVFILGMHEQGQLAYTRNQSIFSIEEREELAKIYPITVANTKYESDVIHFRNICELADVVNLTLATSDLDGKTKLLSSHYKMLLAEKKRQSIIHDPLEFDYGSKEYTNYKALLAGLKARNIDYNKAENLLVEYVEQLYFSNGLLHGGLSYIEKYNQCPFAYFIKYGLNVDRPYIDTIFTQDGNINHHIMEKAYGYHQDGLSDEDIKNEINKEVEQYVLDNPLVLETELIASYLAQKKYDLFNVVKAEIRHYQNTDFKLKEIEYKLDTNSYEIIIDDTHKMVVHGRLDRVDTYTHQDVTYAKVVDYKRYDKDVNLPKILEGLDIQLVLYLDMYTKQNNSKPAGILYYQTANHVLKEKDNVEDYVLKYKMKGYVLEDKFIVYRMDNTISLDNPKSDSIPVALKKDGEFTAYSSVIREKDWQNLFELLKVKIEEIAKQIITGDISIRPVVTGEASGNACKYCPYSSICNRDRLSPDNYQRRINLLSKDDAMKKIGGEE